MKSFYFFLPAFLLSSCSILVGQVKPIEEKSVNSPTGKPVLETLGWTPLQIKGKTESSSDVPDAAWQSPTTAAVISLNSVCRRNGGENDIKEVTELLLSQWDNLKIISEREFTLKNFPAYETSAKGRYLGRDRRFQIAVVKTPTCVYDLIFLSPVQTFDQELSVFTQFRDSLSLK
jgi:hypothetical protein